MFLEPSEFMPTDEDDRMLKIPDERIPPDMARLMATYGVGPMKDNPRQEWLAMSKREAKARVEEVVTSIMAAAKYPGYMYMDAHEVQVNNLLEHNCHQATGWTWAALHHARGEIEEVMLIQEHYGLVAMTSWFTIGIISWLSWSEGIVGGDDLIEQAVERYHLLDKMPTAIDAFESGEICPDGISIIEDCPTKMRGPLSTRPVPSSTTQPRIDHLPRVKFTTKPSAQLEMEWIRSRIKRQKGVEPALPPPSYIEIDIKKKDIVKHYLRIFFHLGTRPSSQWHPQVERFSGVSALLQRKVSPPGHEQGDQSANPKEDHTYCGPSLVSLPCGSRARAIGAEGFMEKLSSPNNVVPVPASNMFPGLGTDEGTIKVMRRNPDAWPDHYLYRQATRFYRDSFLSEDPNWAVIAAKFSKTLYQWALLEEREGFSLDDELFSDNRTGPNEMREVFKAFKPFRLQTPDVAGRDTEMSEV
ncbi:unnamed protein product [Clonostachys rosea]|uniref:Uncharacterized protein n=1 Tax=Bionectria ochroleuca TaxID=29856 RepID=A0ABY6V1U9_BIOOC|nr:unnamed protein product [Clonostachys rosea]